MNSGQNQPSHQAPRQISSLFQGEHVLSYAFTGICTFSELHWTCSGMENNCIVSSSDLLITRGNVIHTLATKVCISSYFGNAVGSYKRLGSCCLQ